MKIILINRKKQRNETKGEEVRGQRFQVLRPHAKAYT